MVHKLIEVEVEEVFQFMFHQKNGGLIYPYQPPPFFGSWDYNKMVGMGIKKSSKKEQKR